MQLFKIVLLLLVVALCVARPALGRRSLSVFAANQLLHGAGLPRYAELRPEYITEAVRQLVRLKKEKIKAIERDEKTDFDALFAALDELAAYDQRVSLLIWHLQDVGRGEKLIAAYYRALWRNALPRLRLTLNPVIYRKLLVLEKDENLTVEQRRMVQLQLGGERDKGVALGLGVWGQVYFRLIGKQLNQLLGKFSRNVSRATKNFQLILRDKDEAAGLPASFLARAAQNYERVVGETASAEAGPWLVTLDFGSYKPFMDYSERRDLREKVYRAFISIASRESYDNTPLIKRVLQLRKEKAQLLGFSNHTARVLSTKMLSDADKVMHLLDDLHAAFYEFDMKEHQQLSAYAESHGWEGKLEPWDMFLWQRKLLEERFVIDTEELLHYFPLPHVLDGLFTLLGKLFSLSITENTAAVQTWHPDVKFYQVHDADGTHIGSFYFDPYHRPNKSRGAWVSFCRNRRVSDGVLEVPVCSVITNFSPPAGGKPTLLDMYELGALFHEFGHAMHVLLTTVDYGALVGMQAVERDASEMPSMLMEKFVYLDNVISTISAHVETGEALPVEIQTRVHAAHKLYSAYRFQKVLLLSYLDLQLHSDFNPDTQDLLVLVRDVATRMQAVPLFGANLVINSLEHVFGGGYDASLYSYLWGEVLAAEVFALFRENGFDDEGLRRSGRKYRDTVLAVGGSKHPRDIFIELLGREPSVKALLKEYGLR